MLAGNGDCFTGQRSDFTHARPRPISCWPSAMTPPPRLDTMPLRKPPVAPSPLNLGHQFRCAGNGFDHAGHGPVIGFALQKAQHHAHGLFGHVRRNAPIVRHALTSSFIKLSSGFCDVHVKVKKSLVGCKMAGRLRKGRMKFFEVPVHAGFKTAFRQPYQPWLHRAFHGLRRAGGRIHRRLMLQFGVQLGNPE